MGELQDSRPEWCTQTEAQRMDILWQSFNYECSYCWVSWHPRDLSCVGSTSEAGASPQQPGASAHQTGASPEAQRPFSCHLSPLWGIEAGGTSPSSTPFILDLEELEFWADVNGVSFGICQTVICTATSGMSAKAWITLKVAGGFVVDSWS